MTTTLTSYKPKEFVILASPSETRDLITVPPNSSSFTLNHSTNGIDSESHSFLVVQNDDYFNKL